MKAHCEPAFPSNNPLYKGMTLRDYFAGQALIAYWIPEGDSKPGDIGEAADFAYRMADEMLKARDV